MVIADNVTLTPEEIRFAEKFHTLIERSMRDNYQWYLSDTYGDTYLDRPSSDLIESVPQYAGEISVEAADNTFGYYGMSILHQLVTHNYYEAVKILLEKGVNPNVRGVAGRGDYTEIYKGVTPLHIACLSGNIKMYQLLVEYGADESLADERNRNCFHFLSHGPIEGLYNHGDSSQSDYNRQCLEIAKVLTCDINHKDDNGLTPLIYLLMHKSKTTLRLFSCYIERGADIMSVDNDGNTTLILAAMGGLVTPSYELMKCGELLNACNNEGNTALHIAYRCENNSCYDLAIAYLLTKQGADDGIKNKEGLSVKEYLAEDTDEYKIEELKKYLNKRRMSVEDMCKMLKSVFANGCWSEDYDDMNTIFDYVTAEIIHKMDIDDDTEFVHLEEIISVYRDDLSRVLRLFHKEGFDICMPFSIHSKKTNLRDMCLEEAGDDPRIMETLKELGIDLDEALSNGCTPAYIVLKYFINNNVATRMHIGGGEKKDPFKELMSMLDYVSAESMMELNNEGTSALHMVAERMKKGCILEYMIERGVDINLTQDAPAKEPGSTPLHLACYKRNVEAVKVLMKAGADDSIMNAHEKTPAYSLFDDGEKYVDEEAYKILELLNTVDTPCGATGETPIMRMMRRFNCGDYSEFIELFLEKGIDINKADSNGNTPLLVHADYACNREVIKLLLEEGADINARNAAGNSALIYVLKDGNAELARYLIKKGADYNVINDRNETPASIAIEKGFDMVLELMTDLTVMPPAEDEEDDDYDYEYDDDDDADDEEEEERNPYEFTEEQIVEVAAAYAQMFGPEKGRRMAELAARMSLLQSRGLEDEGNMAEYMAIVQEFQRVRDGD